MRRWVPAGLVIALLVGACGGEPAASPTEAAAVPGVPGIEAEAVQLRTDAAVGGRIQVRITATGEDPFTVTSVALDSPGFEAGPAVAVDTEFQPGRVVDLRVPLGRVRCDSLPEPAAAELTVVRGSGAAELLRVPLEATVLARLHAAGCAVEALGEVVAVEVGDLRPEGEELVGRLSLSRRSGTEEVRAVRIGRSVLVAVEAELPLVLAGDAQEVAGEVRFTSANCEPHVLSETKQPFRFPLGIERDGEDEVVLDLPVTEEVRAQLQDLVDRICG